MDVNATPKTQTDERQIEKELQKLDADMEVAVVARESAREKIRECEIAKMKAEVHLTRMFCSTMDPEGARQACRDILIELHGAQENHELYQKMVVELRERRLQLEMSGLQVGPRENENVD